MTRDQPVLRTATFFLLAGLFVLSAFLWGCAKAPVLSGLQAGLITAEVADVQSSTRGVEANPLMPSSWSRQALVKAPATAVAIWLSTFLESHGHPRAAQILIGLAAGSVGAVAVHNYQIARQP